MQFEAAAQSHRGWHRPGNEDAGFAGASLLVVADGVGGAAAGEVASTTAASLAAVLAPTMTTGSPWGGQPRTPDTPAAVLGRVVERAGALLRSHAATHPEAAGLATTLTALLTDGTRCGLVHLGDSRAYLLRGRQLRRLTHDHSWGRAMVEDGHLTEEQAALSPYRRRLMRWLGAEDPALGHGRPDLGHLELVTGDRVLLCSDGLTDELDDRLVARLLTTGSSPEPADAVQQLVSAALSAGGRDNVTCVVADVVDRPAVRHDGVLVGAAADTVPTWRRQQDTTASH